MKQEAVIKSILKILEAAIPWDILTIKPTSHKMRVVIWEEKTLINKIDSGNNPKPHRESCEVCWYSLQLVLFGNYLLWPLRVYPTPTPSFTILISTAAILAPPPEPGFCYLTGFVHAIASE